MCEALLKKYKFIKKIDFKDNNLYFTESLEEKKNYIIKKLSFSPGNPHYTEIEAEFKTLALKRTTLSNNPLSPALTNIFTHKENFYLVYEYTDKNSIKAIAAYASVGSFFNNRYIVLKGISSGGFGVVYFARDLNLPARYLAIKEMKDTGKNEMLEKSFKVETEMLSTLKHPSIPDVKDFFTENNRLYLVMDYIEGKTPAQKLLELKEDEFFPEETVVRWALCICSVLSYLHNQTEPVIFRDLKPDNIMITPEGEVKLIDFGIARIFHGLDKKTRYALLSQGYSPPEQYFGKADPRSDIYSFGATFYHILSKKHPAELAPDFPPLRKFNGRVSPELGDIISKTLKLDMKDRYKSIEEVKKDFLKLCDAKERNEKIKSLLEKAEGCEKGEDYINAYTEYMKILEYQEEDREVLQKIASCLEKMDYREKALKYYDRILALPVPETFRDEIVQKKQTLEKEIEESCKLKDSQEIEDNHSLNLNDNEDSGELKKEKTVTFHYRLIAVAILILIFFLFNIYRTQLFNPIQVWYWNDKGQEFLNSGRFEESIDCFEKVLSLEPDNKQAENGKKNALDKFFEELLSKGREESKNNNYKEAVKYYEKILSFSPKNREALLELKKNLINLAGVLAGEGKYKEAMEIYDRIIEEDEEYIDAWYYKGEILYKENKYEEARNCFKKVLEFDVFYNIPEEIIDKLELSALTHAIEKAPK